MHVIVYCVQFFSCYSNEQNSITHCEVTVPGQTEEEVVCQGEGQLEQQGKGQRKRKREEKGEKGEGLEAAQRKRKKEGEEEQGEPRDRLEEVQVERKREGLREVDLSKDDFFMAVAKLATTQSTSKPKVQVYN